jgi:membrane protein DedA with SNARE-associated domain
MEGHTVELILAYRYWIMVPLSFIEGPIVAFFAGTLASAGYFNVWVLMVFFFVRDVVVDLGCYYLGYFGGERPWVKKIIRKFGVTDEHLGEVHALWERNPGKTMFLSKLSYGVAAGFIVVAGLVKMSLRQFMTYGAIVAVLHYGVLLGLGYFFGASFGSSLVGLIEKIPYVIGILATIAIAYYFFKRYINKKLEQAEKEVSAKR